MRQMRGFLRRWERGSGMACRRPRRPGRAGTHQPGRHRLHGMLLALCGSFAIIPEPARPEPSEDIISRTPCEAARRTVLLPFLTGRRTAQVPGPKPKQPSTGAVEPEAA